MAADGRVQWRGDLPMKSLLAGQVGGAQPHARAPSQSVYQCLIYSFACFWFGAPWRHHEGTMNSMPGLFWKQ